MKVLICSNTFWYLYNFRRSLISRLRDNGVEVFLAAAADRYLDLLKGEGLNCFALKLSGAGVNPFDEFSSIAEIRRLVKREGVDLVFSYTSKLNIYSSIATIGMHTVVCPNVSGLGRVFIKKSFLTTVVSYLYQFAFSRLDRVFFQNTEDASLFHSLRIVKPEQVVLLPGSGVDVTRFKPLLHADDRRKELNKPFVFLMAARVLWDKGVGEYVDAARIIKKCGMNVEFRLLGFVDVDNPAAVGSEQVKCWETEGVIQYCGSTDDVLPFLLDADCVVLPSYREGCPRVLLEAASCEKLVITTDVPGCRDVVDDGVSGFLCKVKDAEDLAKKMRDVLSLNSTDFKKMGMRARQKMVDEFDEKYVLEQYMAVVNLYS